MFKIKSMKMLAFLLSTTVGVSLSTSGFAKPTTATAATTSTVNSTYNYGEALQKSLMFYELQRSGKLPTDKRDRKSVV